MNNKFDYLIPEVSHLLVKHFMGTLALKPEFKETIDCAPLLNMTIGTFLTSLIIVMDKIKETTIGEVRLIDNIELAKNSLIKVIEDLPFISAEILK